MAREPARLVRHTFNVKCKSRPVPGGAWRPRSRPAPRDCREPRRGQKNRSLLVARYRLGRWIPAWFAATAPSPVRSAQSARRSEEEKVPRRGSSAGGITPQPGLAATKAITSALTGSGPAETMVAFRPAARGPGLVRWLVPTADEGAVAYNLAWLRRLAAEAWAKRARQPALAERTLGHHLAVAQGRAD